MKAEFDKQLSVMLLDHICIYLIIIPFVMRERVLVKEAADRHDN